MKQNSVADPHVHLTIIISKSPLWIAQNRCHHKTRPKKLIEPEWQPITRSIKALPVDNPISCPSRRLFTWHKSAFCCFKKLDLVPAPFFPLRWISYSKRSALRMRPASLFVIQDASCLLLQQQQQLCLSDGNICSTGPLLAGYYSTHDCFWLPVM